VSLQSPLAAYHRAAGAKLADFGGWEMPIEYPADQGGGVLNEHQAVRERVGLFDVSHLGKAIVRGAGALAALNAILTNDLARISDGQAQYTMLCDDETGGVVDDLIIYRRSETDFLLVPNAANASAVIARINAALPKSVVITDEHRNFGVLALQGPRAGEVLSALGLDLDLAYMSFTAASIAGADVTICRTGYTGEFGYEILPSWEATPRVWEELLAAIAPFDGRAAGLGARDTLRTEMGYPLHGNELSLEISPIAAGASWAVGWKKERFLGRERLLAECQTGAMRTLKGLLLVERGIPRAHMAVALEGRNIGVTTSGTFSPTLRSGIALALVDSGVAIGSKVTIDIRGKAVAAEVVKLPFVPSHVR